MIWAVEIAGLIICIGIAIFEMFLLRHDVSGDTYIHFTFARNLAEGYGFSYNRGEPSSASTGPLWTFILAVLYRFAGLNRILTAARLTAGVLHISSIILLHVLVKQFIPETSAVDPVFFGLVGAGLWSVNPAPADWAMRAMDSALLIVLLLVGGLLFVDFVLVPTGVKAIVLGIVLGLTVLSRVDGSLWVAIAGMAILIKFVPERPQLALITAISGFVTILPYYVWLFARFRKIVPASRARQIHYQRNSATHRYKNLYFNIHVPRLFTSGIYSPLLPLFFIGVGALLVDPNIVQHRLVLAALLVTMMAYAVFYSTVMPTPNYAYRYLLPSLLVLVIFTALGLYSVFTYARPVYVSGILVAYFILYPALRLNRGELIKLRRFMFGYVVEQEEPARRGMAYWVRDNLPADVTVAAIEIDALALYSKPGQRVLSIDGLIGSEAIPYLPDNEQLRFLRDFRPTHIQIEGFIYRYYRSWKQTELACLALAEVGVGEHVMLGGMRFTLLHEERYHYFADQYGKPTNEACPWRLFAITYENSE